MTQPELFAGLDALRDRLNVPFFGLDFEIAPSKFWLLLFITAIGGFLLNLSVASASVRDGISAAAVVFAPEYGSEDDHPIRSHIFSRDCAGSTSPERLASAA